MNKTISQADILKNPAQLLYNLTDSEFVVIQKILFYVAHYGNYIDFNQLYLSEQQGFTRQTANRAVAKFKKLGLVLIKRRRIGCGILSITNYFSLPRVRAAIAHFFSAYPVFRINVSMLLSEYVSSVRIKDTPDPDRRLFRIALNRRSVNEAYQKSDKKVNEVTIRKILDIERALVARGESLETMDTEKLAAFPEECLDEVSLRMKKSQPKQPFGFFMHLCMEWCKQNNQEPVFAKADALRQLNLLAKFREKSRPAGIRDQIKAKEPKRESYSQQVQETRARENAAAEARTRRFSEVQLLDEIAGLKWHVENLTERANKGEPGMVTALMIAKGSLERRLYELSSTHPELYKISTETKVTTVSNTNTAPPTQIVQHMSNLFVDGFKEDEDDEDVLD